MTQQTGGDTDQEAETTLPLTPEEVARRRARELASDNGDASHQGGAGAQGGQADFGLPKNFS
ncbi:hypothetical protein [Sphingomonas profundi]|uniref:hypothetical protein n=1 Tax=Alterirhizorhabdus profundi TaxID=2681549 RepID=UPI0012E71E7E|nr:hypothetical protein [Sphingomonas profundi]